MSALLIRLSMGLLLSLAGWHHALAAAPLLSVAEMETLLHFPAGQLQVVDDTERTRSRKGEGYLSMHGFSGKEHRPISVSVAVTAAGVIWDAAWQSEIERYQQRLQGEQAARGFGPEEARRMAGGQLYGYEGGGRGYVGVGAFGPGGGAIIAYAHFPAQGRDVALTFMLPSKQENEMTDLEALWSKTVATNLDKLVSESLAMAVSRAVGVTTAPMPIPWIQTETTPAQGQLKPAKRKSSSLVEQQKRSEAIAKPGTNSDRGREAARSNGWFAFFGLASIAVIAWFLLRGGGR